MLRGLAPVLVYVGVTACAAAGGTPPGGIHARLGYSEGGGLRVVDTPADGAAARSGLQEGDKIIGIDGARVRELTYVEVVERLRGPVGSEVALEVVRNGEVHRLVVIRQPYRPK